MRDYIPQGMEDEDLDGEYLDMEEPIEGDFTLRATLAGLGVGVVLCMTNIYFGLQTGACHSISYNIRSAQTFPFRMGVNDVSAIRSPWICNIPRPCFPSSIVPVHETFHTSRERRATDNSRGYRDHATRCWSCGNHTGVEHDEPRDRWARAALHGMGRSGHVVFGGSFFRASDFINVNIFLKRSWETYLCSVFLAVPLRKQVIVKEKLVFPSGSTCYD